MVLGVTLGAVIALLHGGAGFLIYRWARSLPPSQGMQVMLAGLVLRLMTAFGTVALVVTYLPVAVTVFVGTLFVVFLLTLILEVTLIQRAGK